MTGDNRFAAEYDDSCDLYGSYASRLAELIERLLSARSIKTLSIEHRLKNRDSYLEKVQQGQSKYHGFKDITDVAGVRVITYYEDDVAKVAETITSEFVIDRTNSVNKGAQLDPDRFGYVSLHYVVSLNDSRSVLPEYG